MFSRYFKLRRESSKKKDKEIALTAQNDSEQQDAYTVKIPHSILAEHSEFFRDLTKMEIKKFKKSKLEGMTVTALKKIAEYMQTGDVIFQTHIEALETLKGAEKYKIVNLQKLCVEYLITIVESSNVCEVFETALTLSLCHLEYSCLKHIDEHFEDIFTSRGFLTLEKSTVRRIITRNSLKVGSEKAIFDAVLGWGFNDNLRKGLDPNDQEELMCAIKSLLSCVRFSMMSEDELRDQEVDKYQGLMVLNGPWNRERSISTVSEWSGGTTENFEQPRHYVPHYVACLNVYESVQHTIKDGETFCLRIEILKSTVFLTGVTLAIRRFAPTKDTACLYVVVTATNVMTMEQTTKRGAFLNTSEKASLVFPTPLVAKESERVEIALSVKRAENICPFAIRRDVQIAMPECQSVAMKIIPSVDSTETEEHAKCIFRELEYFF